MRCELSDVAGPSKQPQDPSQQRMAAERDEIIRQLSEHANRCGGQYALMYYDACGRGQLNATPAYKKHIQKWLPQEVTREARSVALSAVQDRLARRTGGDKKGKMKEIDTVTQGYTESGWTGTDPMLQHLEQLPLETHIPYIPGPFTQPKAPSPMKRSKKRKSVSGGNVERDHRRAADSTSVSAEYVALRISDEEAVSSFYLTRFRQMQQLMCKLIAKNWIKVIEPKKQTNYPYNRGDVSKPSWWPADVRHKEPDHLMKPERLTLLLTMIRCNIVPIKTLEGATGTTEVQSQIPEERMPLLKEVYRVARQEERYRRGELPPSTLVHVASSDKHIRSAPRKGSTAGTNSRNPDSRRNSFSSTDSNRTVGDENQQMETETSSSESRLLSPISTHTFGSSPNLAVGQGMQSPMQYEPNPGFGPSPAQSPVHHEASPVQYIETQMQQMPPFFGLGQPQQHQHRHSIPAYPVHSAPHPPPSPGPSGNPGGFWSPQMGVSRVHFPTYGSTTHSPLSSQQGNSPVSPGGHVYHAPSPMQRTSVLHDLHQSTGEASQGGTQGFTDFLQSELNSVQDNPADGRNK